MLPEISLGDIHAALAYYFDNRKEMDETSRKDNAAAEKYWLGKQLVNDTPANIWEAIKEYIEAKSGEAEPNWKSTIPDFSEP